MKNYRLYEITDFVIDDDFIRWVQDNEEGDNQFWKRWLDQNPDKHLVIAEAKRIVELIPAKTTDNFSKKEIDQEVDLLLQTIRQHSEERVLQDKVHFMTKWWYAAAAVLIIASSTLFYLNRQKASEPSFTYASLTSLGRLTERVNRSEKPVAVNLPDGSVIQLAKNSRVSYATRFDSSNTRDIYLSGEAFFVVTKNPGRPFRVFANELVTKVLGTSFTVRSFDTASVIMVTVRTGKVSVYDQQSTGSIETAAPNKLGGVIVTPNQQLVYERSKQKFQKILLDNPSKIRTGPDKETLVYEDAPLEKVFNDLRITYGINIVFEPETIGGCTVTADLNNETFYQKLDLICRAVGAQYKVADGQVIIDSNGCK